MGLFSAAELADFRAEQEATFDRTCRVDHAVAGSVSATGAPTWTWPAGASVACRKRPVGAGTEAAFGDRIRGRKAWEFSFAHGTTVLGTDRIYEGGQRHDVVDPDDDHTDGTRRAVLAVEVTG